MSSASPAPSGASTQEGHHHLLATCLDRSIEAFLAAGLASQEEAEQVRIRYTRAVQEEAPRDTVEILARIQGAEEEHLGSEVARISQAVASVIPPLPPSFLSPES